MNKIEKEYVFDDFRSAISFVNNISKVAEDMNHHPDIEISYNKVKLTFTTHSEGKVTEKDHILSQIIDKKVKEMRV